MGTDPDTPCISLVIPAWNEEKYITPTLESVARAQEAFERSEAGVGRSIEVIVVDNASTDRTAEIARSFGCTVVPFEKHQIAAARNAGAKAARGEYIAFVDADRSIVPDSLFIEIAATLDDPAVFGGGSNFRPEHWSFCIFLFAGFFRTLFWVMRIGAVLYYLRRADFEALGGWNEELYAAEDLDLSVRMKRAAKRSGRRFRNLRGKVSICTRKLELIRPLHALWLMICILVRWDFRSPKRVGRFLYDVDKLR